MDFEVAQQEFMKLIEGLEKNALSSYLKWVKTTAEDRLKDVELSNEDTVMGSIRCDLRDAISLSATMPSENILFPTVGENADCDPTSTVHVDAFLYDEEQVDDLCDEGKLSRNFCKQCGSHNVDPLTFISHSVSMSQIKYLYQFLLPDLRGKTVLDVGSRLGGLLFGAYYYSTASKIVGVEINQELCQLQQNIVKKYQLLDRIKIIHADICTQADTINSADVVILHNVFEFFAPLDVQAKIWTFLYETVRKPGCLLVVSPRLEDQLKHLQIGFTLDNWVKPLCETECVERANLYLFGAKDSEDSDLENIHLYQVISHPL